PKQNGGYNPSLLGKAPQQLQAIGTLVRLCEGSKCLQSTSEIKDPVWRRIHLIDDGTGPLVAGPSPDGTPSSSISFFHGVDASLPEEASSVSVPGFVSKDAAAQTCLWQ